MSPPVNVSYTRITVLLNSGCCLEMVTFMPGLLRSQPNKYIIVFATPFTVLLSQELGFPPVKSSMSLMDITNNVCKHKGYIYINKIMV